MRHLVRLAAVGLVLALVGAGVVGAATTAGSSSKNRAAARRDAQALLSKLTIPAGATRLASRPTGDNGYLKPLPELVGDLAHAVAHEWFSVPGTPDQVIAFVRAHAPSGGRLFGTGSSGNARSGTSAQSLYYQWPSVRGVLGERELVVTATALSGSQTGVLVESQSDWIVVRPASETIPASQTHEIEITSGTDRTPQAEAFTVTAPAKVRRIVAIVNALPVAQPIVYACPGETDPRLITMTFRASADGPPLAVLHYDDFRPWSGPSEVCKTVGLTIRGVPQDALIGGDFLRRIGRLLGRSLI